ncbi:hypothetical protein [Paraflavitalea speifideaquila]|uniref:hypothetical protein n=1 Tax=Paraflavitalea speifideaquila TaxID=3076558 RepID=UPI0028E3BF59|nr:hypothetical protein [Paraflavitalea speifideiaquila]
MNYTKLLLVAAIGICNSNASAQWSLTGNSSTTPGTHFLGTTDNKNLIIKTNNLEAMTITANGNLGVGTLYPKAKLHLTRTNNSNWSANVPDNALLMIGGQDEQFEGQYINFKTPLPISVILSIRTANRYTGFLQIF